MKFIILFYLLISYSLAQLAYPLEEYKFLQPYGNQFINFGNKYHCADDLVGKGGTPVNAIADGEIVFSSSMDGYGWLIVIEHHALGVYSLYGHLSTKRIKRPKGSVKKGEQIAFLADDEEDGSGSINGSGRYPYWPPHLHFGIRKGKISDYTERTANRWMAGYTPKHPSNYNWLDPKKYIDSINQKEQK